MNQSMRDYMKSLGIEDPEKVQERQARAFASKIYLKMTYLASVIFITLQGAGVIHWDWWWLIAPVWITVAFDLAKMVMVGLLGLIGWVIQVAKVRKQSV